MFELIVMSETAAIIHTLTTTTISPGFCKTGLFQGAYTQKCLVYGSQKYNLLYSEKALVSI